MFSGQRSLIILDKGQLHAKDNDISSDNDIVQILLSLRTSPKQSLGRVASDLILIRRILNNNKSENLSFHSDISIGENHLKQSYSNFLSLRTSSKQLFENCINYDLDQKICHKNKFKI